MVEQSKIRGVAHITPGGPGDGLVGDLPLPLDRVEQVSGRLPNFLIVGAMRSGTTSLARCLRAHPQVFMGPQKEVHFFDRQMHRGLGWYRQQFAMAGSQPRVGEATQTYMYDDQVPDRLAAALPGALLVAILRNPVDRAYSHYWLKVSHGQEPLSFDEALRAEPGRLVAADQQTRFNYSYVDRGRYVRQLRSLERHFSRDSIYVVLFEDLRDRPEETFAQLCEFLEIDPSVRPDALGRPVNGHTKFRSLRLRRISLRSPALLGRAMSLVNARQARYQPMEAGTRARLSATFRADNRQLEEWLGRSLSVWDD